MLVEVARRLRYILPWVMQLITVQCFQGRYLLRPSKRLNQLIKGVVAVAKERFPDVMVCIITTMSNHYHMIIIGPDGEAIARFMEFVDGQIAREAGRMHDWEGDFWHSRYSSENIVDEDSQIACFEYVLAQGCKEGLVHDPGVWPGVNCVDALTSGSMKLAGIWIDRTGLCHARKRDESVSETEFTREVELELAPIPAWAHLTPKEYRQKCRKLVRKIKRKAKAKYGGRFMGVKRVLKMDPHHRPDERASDPEPYVHAKDTDTWANFMVKYRLFVARYRAASNGRKARQTDLSAYPPHCFLPGGFYYAG